MTKLYKLTTSDFKTRKGEYNECLWGEGVTHSGTGTGDLCSPGYVHAYTDPLLAVFLNPIHADLHDPVLWECEGEVVKNDRGLKVGCVSLTTTRRIELPAVTTEQRVKFALLCALEVYDDPAFAAWARSWLSGEDRSEKSAVAAGARAAVAAGARAAVAAWAAWGAAAAAEIDLIALARKAVA